MQFLLFGIIAVIIAIWVAGFLLHLAGGIIKLLFGVTGVLILIIIVLLRTMRTGGTNV